MSIVIIEARPGQWRWGYIDAFNRILSASRLFSCPMKCLLNLTQIANAAADIE